MSEAIASTSKCQYSYRSQKTTGTIAGPPDYSRRGGTSSETPVKHYSYSPDGQFYAVASGQGVRIEHASSGQHVSSIDLPAVVEIGFSPQGNYLSTWERPIKLEDGAQHCNLKVWRVDTGEEVLGFTQKSQSGWNFQYTEDEQFAARMGQSEVQLFRPSAFKNGIYAKLRVEGATICALSPGRNPSIAVFVPEKKGSPASLKVYSLSTITPNMASEPVPTAQKTFFKADKVTIKWNQIGTMLLLVTQTDVDKTNKSYFGETNMYLLNASDSYSVRVAADKEGPIHDFCWSPNSKEFTVIYGYMPAKTVIYDHRVNVVADLGIAPRNFVLYNPQGRLLLLAGFGNLNGAVQIWDRKTLTKVASFDGANTSHCEWAPDGRHVMCATLSPRLRVDNGIRIIHWSGTQLHHDDIPDLYQASWQPQPANLFPFRQALSPAPASTADNGDAPATPAKETPKPAGAYRPPHARGTLTPDVFKREDQGGSPAPPKVNGSATNGSTTLAQLQIQPKKRTVPGAAAPSATNGEEKASRRKKKGDANGNTSSSQQTPLPSPGLKPSTPTKTEIPPLPMDGAPLSPDDKKRRAITKKLGAIDILKEKRDRGEKLEKTQLDKIATEPGIRDELAALDI